MRRAIASALLVATAASAQQAPPADPDQTAHDLIDRGRYLGGVRVFEGEVFAAGKDPTDADRFGTWQQFAAMLSEVTPTVPLPKPAPAPDPAALRGVTLADALPAIVERARTTRIVILNESHATPRDRAFALTVTRALRPLGYRTLALETLNNAADDAQAAAMMARLTGDGCVRHQTGVYTQDPAYADFVRQALALGYRPVAYEQASEPSTIEAREQAQADFLAKRAVPKGPGDGKLLVYVGYSHAAEAPLLSSDGQAHRWMAARLKAITGIDPLTIDQATFADEQPGDRDEQAHRLLPDTSRSAVLMQGGRPFVWGRNAGAMDLQVVHPPVRLVQGRPDWLLAMGRRPVPIPPALLPAKGLRLVQAFLANEAADAVPIDQVLVTAGRPAPSLMLPPGKPVRYATEDDPGDPPLHAARQ